MRERETSLAQRMADTALLAALDDDDRLALAKAAVRRPLKRRQRLYVRGERGDALVLVLSGRVDVVRGDVTLRSLATGAIFGLSTIGGAPHSADVVAAERAEVLLIGGRHVRALFARRPEVALKIVAALGDLVSQLTDDIEALRHSDVLERTRRKLAQLAKGRREIAVTHAELAAQVGATRANTSRALAKLETAGVIRRRRGRIELR